MATSRARGICETNPHYRRREREQDRFGEHLARDAAVSGPERAAYCGFVNVRRRSSEQQVRDVDTGHEQNQRDPASRR